MASNSESKPTMYAASPRKNEPEAKKNATLRLGLGALMRQGGVSRVETRKIDAVAGITRPAQRGAADWNVYADGVYDGSH